ncbi:MAG: SAM-dependent methyltransferase [Dehalococcoidia bacterium]|nr:SAM-dependent methyltransferase [Dehalococcoidia bacterium]
MTVLRPTRQDMLTDTPMAPQRLPSHKNTSPRDSARGGSAPKVQTRRQSRSSAPPIMIGNAPQSAPEAHPAGKGGVNQTRRPAVPAAPSRPDDIQENGDLPSRRADESWEKVADWYDALASERGTEFHQHVVIPGLLSLLDLKPGEKVCDLACGQGAVTQALARAGAQVTGVDLSPRLIELARHRPSKGIRYVLGDARSVPDLKSDSFDAITCVLAAMNIDPVAPLFTEMSRLLRPGGRSVIVVLHPAFRIPRQSRWRWDEGRKMQTREVDRYLSPLSIPIDMKPFNRPGEATTTTHHRPVSAYVNGFARAGLAVTALEEWPSHKVSQQGPKARAENRAREEFPLFMALRAVKLTVN